MDGQRDAAELGRPGSAGPAWLTRLGWTAVGVLVLAAHVLLLVLGVARAAAWLGGVVTAAVVLAVMLLHGAGLRRMLATRRRQP